MNTIETNHPTHVDLSTTLRSIPGARVFSNGVALPNGNFHYVTGDVQALYDSIANGETRPTSIGALLDTLRSYGLDVKNASPKPPNCGESVVCPPYGILALLSTIPGYIYFNNATVGIPASPGHQAYTGYYGQSGDILTLQSYLDLRNDFASYNVLPDDMMLPGSLSTQTTQSQSQTIIGGTQQSFPDICLTDKFCIKAPDAALSLIFIVIGIMVANAAIAAHT